MRWQLQCPLRYSIAVPAAATIAVPAAVLNYGIYCGACCGGSYIRGIFGLIRGIFYLLIRRIFFTALFARHFVTA